MLFTQGFSGAGRAGCLGQGVFAFDGGWENPVKEYVNKLGVEGGGFTRWSVAHYWSALDSSCQLLEEIATDWQRDLDDWRTVLRKAMFEAFKAACPHETPRQIRAYAKAKKLLRIKEKKDAPAS